MGGSARPTHRTGAVQAGRPGNRGKRRPRSKAERFLIKLEKRTRFLDSLLFTAVAVLALVLVFVLTGQDDKQYEHFQAMKQAVEHEFFYDGVRVDGVDVSGMTLQQAKDYFAQNVEPKYAATTVSLNNGTSYTSAEFGYSSDYLRVLEEAFGVGREGSLEERYALLTAQKHEIREYTVTRKMYTDRKLEEYIGEIEKQVNVKPVDAKVEMFNTTDWTFTFTQSSEGYQLDAEKLAIDIKAALDAGGGYAELKIDTVEPEITTEEIPSMYGLITTAMTNAQGSAKERLYNIKLACKLISGTAVGVGDTFSYNDTIGERTEERGFKIATAYSSGAITQEIGGGICQVSTTLFNAAVKSDMKIVERHNHSLTISYVDLGKDAAVNWRSHDFRFRNDTDDTVYIKAYLTDSYRVVVEVYGKLLKNGEYITVETETTEEIPFEVKTTVNPESTSPEEKLIQEGKNGFKAVAYKVRWNADGTQISRKKLCDSYYNPISQIVEVGVPSEE